MAPMAAERLRRRRKGTAMTRRNCLPQPILCYILERHSFKRKSGGRPAGKEDIHHHYRKGIAGDWRNYFTPRVTDAFKAQYGDLLIRLNYESSHDWQPS
jgi:lipopolysaccharide transport system ATP-binding protein